MTDTDLALAEQLVERLRARVDSGQRTLGGGSIGHDGKGSMWGGEKIMVDRNPDGPMAADLIERLAARLRANVAVGEIPAAFADAIKVLRCVTAHEADDADDLGQSITATNAAAKLEASIAEIRWLWKESAFPRDPGHAGELADRMDAALAAKEG